MAKRICLDCGAVTLKSRCPSCLKKWNTARNARRTHYHGDYRTRAKQVRENAEVCWLCGQGPRVGDPWQADHIRAGDPTSPLAPAHRTCNASRGNGTNEPFVA